MLMFKHQIFVTVPSASDISMVSCAIELYIFTFFIFFSSEWQTFGSFFLCLVAVFVCLLRTFIVYKLTEGTLASLLDCNFVLCGINQALLTFSSIAYKILYLIVLEWIVSWDLI